MPDLHNHTPLCHHAIGDPTEYIARARELGITEYGFAEHSPWMFQYDGEQIAPTPEEFREYLDRMESLQATEKKQHGGINLRIGIELDFMLEKRATAFEMIENYPFDFHIGSVHNLGTWIFDHPNYIHLWETKNVRAVYEEYFAALRSMLEWGVIDILGHLDLPKKFGHVPAEGYADLVEDLLPLIIESGAVVEINTAGKEKAIGEFYPSPALVARLAKAGVPFTIGSDAHKPADVGRHRDEAIELLRAHGVKEVISFHQRRRIGVRI